MTSRSVDYHKDKEVRVRKARVVNMREAKAVSQSEDGAQESGAPDCDGQACGHDHGTGPPKDFLDTTKPAWEGFPDVTTSAEAHVFAQKLIADFNDARDARIKTHQGVDAPDVPLSGPAAEDPRRKVTEIDYQRFEELSKELDREKDKEEKKAKADKDKQIMESPDFDPKMFMGCSHDHSKERAIFEKSTQEKISAMQQQ